MMYMTGTGISWTTKVVSTKKKQQQQQEEEEEVTGLSNLHHSHLQNMWTFRNK